MSRLQLERVAVWTPALIIGYFAIQYAVRVLLSGNLETDEAQFVGQTYFALGYGNSHPPLYNWLVAGALALTGGDWPSAVPLVKNALLAGTYLLAFDAVRRVTGRALTGLIVVASFLMLPQIVWQSQVTLAHSVLVMFAVIAVVHAVVLIFQRGDALSFLWFGLAAAIGALAKYNFFLMLVALLAAALSLPELRRRLFTSRLAYAAALFAALFTPHLVWALENFRLTTQRMEKMEQPSDRFGALDLPWIGLDGFLETLMATAAWAAPLVVIWAATIYLCRWRNEGVAIAAADSTKLMTRLFGRTTAIGLAAFALIVLVGDLHSVHERYLTPVLMTFPLWLALAWPLEAYPRGAVRFLRLGMVLAILMVTAWPAWILFGREQLAYPYKSFAMALNGNVQEPFVILAHQQKYGANLAIRLDNARIWQPGARAPRVMLVWERNADQPPRSLAAKLGEAYRPDGPVMVLAFPYNNFSGNEARLRARLYARKP